MNDNMKLWDAVAPTDPRFTKPVNDGRHTFTTISAYYQFKQATEQFGPYGGSWCLYDMQRTFMDEICVFDARFRFPGGDFQIQNAIKWRFNNGKIDDDFAKKLETDTITKALSRLGFNADVFMGMFDDNRYVGRMYEEFVYITGEQIAELNKRLEETNSDLEKFLEFMQVDSLAVIPKDDFQRAIKSLEAKAKKAGAQNENS